MTLDSNVEETMKIEVEADKLAIKWLAKHYKETSLKKICSYIDNKWKKKRR
jgi:hypothetical protein